jgi:hypothetical protein
VKIGSRPRACARRAECLVPGGVSTLATGAFLAGAKDCQRERGLLPASYWCATATKRSNASVLGSSAASMHCAFSQKRTNALSAVLLALR